MGVTGAPGGGAARYGFCGVGCGTPVASEPSEWDGGVRRGLGVLTGGSGVDVATGAVVSARLLAHGVPLPLAAICGGVAGAAAGGVIGLYLYSAAGAFSRPPIQVPSGPKML